MVDVLGPNRWLVETIFHRDVIQREISRVLVLNLSGEKRGARHCKGDLRP